MSVLVAVVISIISLFLHVPVPLSAFTIDCTTLMPSGLSALPQVFPSPFQIKVSKLGYEIKDVIEVEIRSLEGKTFQMMMIQAWKYGRNVTSGKSVGVFKESDEMGPDCGGLNNALITKNQNPKSYLKIVWRAPSTFVGHLQFKATFIENVNTFWVREASAMLADPTIPLPLPDFPPDSALPLIHQLNTSDCGKTRGCYREPHGCWELFCDYLVTWKDLGDKIEFEMSMRTDGMYNRWMMMGLSKDIWVGADSVMECSHNADFGIVDVNLAYNKEDSNERQRLERPKQGIIKEEGSYYRDRLRCRFIRDKFVDGTDARQFPLTPDNAWHIMLAGGKRYKGNKYYYGHGIGELPIVSVEKVTLDSTSDISGIARYPLAKAHGILMILAWVYCSSIGFLMAKYYKKMWPNSRIFGKRYWLVVHAIMLTFIFIFTIIGFILIFVEAGGYSKAWKLPLKAHPIMGIIITVCIIIIPIIALIQPDKNSKYRPVFNWLYWLFCTVALILAVPTNFIGMDFGKNNFPWWSTWILVVIVIVHLIIEVTLEIHDCYTHKKNKERQQKYELLKRENPKLHIPEPRPVGHRFKKFMLFIHVTITTILTLILVIVMAAS